MNLERLFYLREEKDMTQEQLGKIVNTKKWSITKWENGKEIIPLEKLNIYSNYFNVSMDYILRLTDNRKTNNNIDIIDPKIVGNNIKKIRSDNKLTQRMLAKELGTAQSTIWGYEQGKFLILTAFAYQICVKYNISIDWLCGKSNNIRIK